MWDEYQRRLKIWDDVQIKTRLDGDFYHGALVRLYPDEWLDLSEALARELLKGIDPETEEPIERAPTHLGLDLAQGGGDLTVWSLIDDRGLLEQHCEDTPETMHIAGKTIEYIREHNLSPSNVILDAGGGGKQVSDRIREQGYNVEAVAFGKAATDSTAYANMRNELFGMLRYALDPKHGGFAIPEEYIDLRHELSVMPIRYDSEGRLALPKKGWRERVDSVYPWAIPRPCGFTSARGMENGKR